MSEILQLYYVFDILNYIFFTLENFIFFKPVTILTENFVRIKKFQLTIFRHATVIFL